MKKTLIALTIVTASMITMGFSLKTSPTEALAVKTITPQVGTNIGDKAPEISMNNMAGENMKLSDLSGNIVLIDFWASWCGPCRRENPNVVNAYNKYKKAKFKKAKGFEVFSVSLDNDVTRWSAAVEKDGLKWSYHVSDLKKWRNEAAATYGVSSIPYSYLLDQDGIIVAKALRGMALHTSIDKFVKKL